MKAELYTMELAFAIEKHIVQCSGMKPFIVAAGIASMPTEKIKIMPIIRRQRMEGARSMTNITA